MFARPRILSTAFLLLYSVPDAHGQPRPPRPPTELLGVPRRQPGPVPRAVPYRLVVPGAPVPTFLPVRTVPAQDTIGPLVPPPTPARTTPLTPAERSIEPRTETRSAREILTGRQEIKVDQLRPTERALHEAAARAPLACSLGSCQSDKLLEVRIHEKPHTFESPPASAASVLCPSCGGKSSATVVRGRTEVLVNAGHERGHSLQHRDGGSSVQENKARSDALLGAAREKPTLMNRAAIRALGAK